MVLLFLVFLAGSSAFGGVLVWVNEQSGSWFDTSSWRDANGGAHSPADGDTLFVDFDRSVRVSSPDRQARYGNLVVGFSGGAYLEIASDIAGVGDTFLGFRKGSSGAVTISDANAEWYTNFLTIGAKGGGSVHARDATVRNNATAIGYFPSGAGTMSFESGTFRTQHLGIGIGGKGQAWMGSVGRSDFHMTTSTAVMGAKKHGYGEMSFRGGEWQAEQLSIGDVGRGNLAIVGGLVTTQNGYLGYDRGARGTLEMDTSRIGDGPEFSSTLVVSGAAFDIGKGGTGILDMRGGSISAQNSILGVEKGGRGTASITGGTWTTDFDFVVGSSGSGAVTIADEGVLTVQNGLGTMVLGQNAGAKGVLNIGAGGGVGELRAAGITSGEGKGVVNFDHEGSLSFSLPIDGASAVNKLGEGTTIFVGDNGYSGDTTIHRGILQLGDNGTSGSIGSARVNNKGTLAFDRADTLEFGAVIRGKGGVQQIGSGATILTGANKYQGTTTIENGRLEVANEKALGKSEVVLSGGVLATDGQIHQISINRGLSWNSDARISLTLDMALDLSEFVKVSRGIEMFGDGKLTFDFLTGDLSPGEASFLVMSVRSGYGDLTNEDFAFVSSDTGLTGTFRMDGDDLFFDMSYSPGLNEGNPSFIGRVSAIPEPSTFALIGAGFGLLLFRRKT